MKMIKKKMGAFNYTLVLIAFFVLSIGLGLTSGQVNAVGIFLYGKIVDQSDQTVVDATVHGLVYDSLDNKAEPARKITSATDADGCFEISTTGARLEILSIKKAGYDFSNERKKVFSYAGLPADKLFVPVPADPVVFTIRKKNPPAFLVRSESLMRFKPGQDKPYILSTGGTFRDFSKALQEGKQIPVGLKVTANLSQDSSAYELTFNFPNDESGIITADELLHECPAEGYVDQAVMKVIIPDKAKEIQKYIYVKAKGSGGAEWTYSRINLNIIVGKAELIIKTTSWTNPDGSRNLEYDEKYQRKEITRRLEEYRNNPNGKPMPSYLRQQKGKNWDFTAQRRRANKQKREYKRAAEGKIKEKKRNISKAGGE